MSEVIFKSRSSTPVPLAQNQNSLVATEYVLKDLPHLESIEFPLKCNPKKSKPESVATMISMCGGINNIKETFQSIALAEAENNEETHSNGQPVKDSSKPLELYLNRGLSEDAQSIFFNEHPLIGRPNKDERLLLKIKIKRKKNSLSNPTSKKITDKFENNVGYTATPVAVIGTTIKFRSLSDFQIILDKHRSAREYDQSFNKLKWENLKSFVNSIEEKDKEAFYPLYGFSQNKAAVYELAPPTKFSMVDIPFVYQYKRNPYHDIESGCVKKKYVKSHQIQIASLEVIPTTPPDILLKNMESAKKLGYYPGTNSGDTKFLQDLQIRIEELKKLFEIQPIWIKKHLDGILSTMESTWGPMIRFGLAFVSYRILKGPWRNTYCKFGIDPTSDSKYAKYQTESFRIERSANDIKYDECPTAYETDTPGEIDSRFHFTGKQIPWYSTYQMFQLSYEPNIKEIIDTTVYLDEPNDITGWYSELDLWKIRKIIKYELGCLIQGNKEFSSTKLKIIKEMPFLKGYNTNSTFPKKEKNLPYAKNSVSPLTSNEDTINTQPHAEDDDEDNGVQAGNENAHGVDIPEDMDDDDDDNDEFLNNKFDLDSASYNEILQRISLKDPEFSKYMESNIEGLVKADKL